LRSDAEALASLPPELLALRSVAAALVSTDGRLLEWNEGFRALLPEGSPALSGAPVSTAFIQPALGELLARASDHAEPVYEGLLTLGDRAGKTYTLRGRVVARPGGISMVAEHDVGELERLYQSSLTLTQELAEAQRELARAYRRIREVSLTDPLTGVGNRRRLDERLSAEIDRSGRHGDALSLVMCDLDHFKHINDTFGHDAGDRVLAAFAGLLRAQVRSSDLVARYGGEEFLMVLPQTAGASAERFAERMRGALERTADPGVPRRVTASFGVAQWRAGESGEESIRRADRALYRAKQEGRNRVATADD